MNSDLNYLHKFQPESKVNEMKNTIICLMHLMLLSTAAVLAQDLFVAVDGSDTNPGTAEKPLATLEGARDKIRRHKIADKLPTEGFNVWLSEGVYPLKQTFELNEKDAGSESSPIVYQARKDHKVMIIGGRQLSPSLFHPVTDPTVLGRLDTPAARKNLYEIDLPDAGIRDFGKHRQYGHSLSVVPAPLELFFNDNPMPLARYPNEGFILLEKVIDPGSVPRWGDYSERGGTFEYTDPRHARWQGIEDVWLQGTFNYGYADDKIRIASIDPETRQVTLTSPHMYGLAAGKPYRKYIALNILEELDMPGEWYLDRTSGKLYFWPPADLAAARIIVSVLEGPLVALEGVSHVTFKSLTFEAGRGMGIYMERGENNRIERCTVRNLGTTGIFMGQGARQTFPHITHDDYEGVAESRTIGNLQGHIYKYTTWDRKAGTNHSINACEVYNTGSGGIYLSGGSKKDLTPGNSRASNCRIHDYNRRNKFLWAGINVDGCGNEIVHNEIYNSNFQGIYVHGNEHLFEYNHLHHLALDSDDTSAWYIGRDPSDRGNMIRYNFFHHVGGRPGRMVMGIYFDDASCGATVHGNVFYKTADHGAVFSNAGHDITISNNIFIETYGPAVWLNSYWRHVGPAHMEYYFGENGLFPYRLYELLDIRKPPYSTRYPELTDWLDKMPDGKTVVGTVARRFIVKNNLIVNCPDVVKLTGEQANLLLKDNYVANDRDMFADYDNLNFRLRSDAEVYTMLPEFEKIPFDKIGPIPENAPPSKQE